MRPFSILTTETIMNFNLDDLDSQATKTFDVIIGYHEGPLDDKGAKTKGEPVGFRVVGSNSDQYTAVSRRIDMLNIQEAAQRNKSGLDPNSEVDMTTEVEAARVVEAGEVRRKMIANACTVGWFGFTVGETNELAGFDTARLQKTFDSRPKWVRMVVEAIETDANFI